MNTTSTNITNSATQTDSMPKKNASETQSDITVRSRPIPHEVSDTEIIQKDFHTMIHFSAQRGISIPSTITLNEPSDDATLIGNYNTMVTAVKPSTVQSINYVNNQILGSDGEDKKWHQTPIISKCLIIATVALICLIAVSLLPEVNSKNQSEGLLSSQGLVLFYNLLFICSASLLGVMFYLLKTISDKIKNYTLLPVDAIEVNATIIIGVISGFIISELFTFNASAIGSSIETQKMTLALLGGFSSDAMFSVLKGIVGKMKSLFSSQNGE